MKSILLRCMGDGKDVHQALYEWRNAPRGYGYSPAQLQFGRSQCMLVPQPTTACSHIDFHTASAAKDKLHAQPKIFTPNFEVLTLDFRVKIGSKLIEIFNTRLY